ncbi:hypothetical protein TRFO_05951 [Tritrichomonas foetus]|uniref:J domain-containing protein n=1 Tax=Tritrichomonas foetus TaxID=1144522 RepID=A0A1J4K3F7_9EUKA|nr:hypothetical protein TRFO_05951 [Tritrichomonas foetus]|eukprot:OHT05368.1 hypothetical protein TRFO_05951 [Tritrichomonas foetus]
MILFACFFYPVYSLLAKGQDPYAILGIEKRATPEQIKKAFRAKTHKFHPDRYKGPDAQKKWLQISDAYELLKDPKKRERYDKFGFIDESLQEQPKGPNRADKIRTILAQDSASRSMNKDFGEFDYRKKPDVITNLNDDNFRTLTLDGRPWVIYAYREEYEINQHKDMLEDLFQKTGFLFGIGKLSVSFSPKTAQFLNIQNAPQVIVYDPKSNKVSHFSGQPTLKSVTRFASQKFGADVTIVHDDHEILVWRKSNLDKLHVILFSDLKDVPTSFELAAAFLKQNAVFAFASVNQMNMNNYPRALGSLSLSELPTYIIYRMGQPKDDTFGGPVIPIVAPMDLDAGQLSAIIRRYHYPVFAELNAKNFERLSVEGYCIIYVKGVEMAEDIKIGTNDMNIPTGSINTSIETEFSEKFNLEPGDFIVIKPKTKQYLIWKEVTTWGEFRKRYELMQHGLESYQKVDVFPNFTTPLDSKSEKIEKISEKIVDLKFILDDIQFRFSTWIKKIPIVYVFGLLALTLIIFGEILVCLCGKCFSVPDEKYHSD